MDTVLAGLEAQLAELDGLIAPVDDAAWSTPSRCAGWSIGDVVLHLAQTNEMALGSLRGDYFDVLARLTDGLPPAGDIDDGAGAMVDKERGAPPADVYARWRSGADELLQRFSKADPRERVQWVVGTLSAWTLATTRLAETWIHTRDVAFGLGVTLPASERMNEIAALAWRTLPYAFERAGRTMHGSVEMQLTGWDGNGVSFTPPEPAATIVRGTVADLCEVAGQRATAPGTSLTAEGPDAEGVLELIRTFA